MATTTTTEQINSQLKLRLNAQAMEIIRLRQENEELKKKEKKDNEGMKDYPNWQSQVEKLTCGSFLQWSIYRPLDREYQRVFVYEVEYNNEDVNLEED